MKSLKFTIGIVKSAILDLGQAFKCELGYHEWRHDAFGHYCLRCPAEYYDW